MMAPSASDGINNPQGTFMPNVKIVITSFIASASVSSQIALYTPGPAAAISIAELTSVKLRL